MSVLNSKEFTVDPLPTIRALQARGAVVEEKLPIVGRMNFTTTHAGCAQVLKNSTDFTMRKNGKVAGMQWWMPRTITLLANNMLSNDDPDHARLRTLVDRAFRRDMIAGMKPMVDNLVDELADQYFTKGEISDFLVFSRAFPLAVICELLGLKAEDRPKFTKWASGLSNVTGLTSFMSLIPSLRSLTKFLSKEVEEQKHAPREGLIGALVELQREGADISEDELVSMVFLLLIAGHETTTHVVSGGLLEFLRHPEQRALLMEEGAIPMAVEETLRYVSAVQFSKPRFVHNDIEVDGVEVKAGSKIMAMIAAANFDESQFDRPEIFDIRRAPNKHLSFGSGPHFCLGLQLARLEIASAFEGVFQRFPDMQLGVDVEKIEWRKRLGLRVLKELPIRF